VRIDKVYDKVRNKVFEVIDKPAAQGGAGVRKQGSGFSAPGINNEVTYENARIDKVRDKVFPEP
jgi:hypothetical protein